jgi:hypothetical protein
MDYPLVPFDSRLEVALAAAGTAAPVAFFVHLCIQPTTVYGLGYTGRDFGLPWQERGCLLSSEDAPAPAERKGRKGKEGKGKAPVAAPRRGPCCSEEERGPFGSSYMS